MSFIKTLFKLILLAAFILVVASIYYVTRPLTPATLPLDFTLQPGSSLKSVAHQMKLSGLLDDEQVFVLLGRGMGLSGKIKYGNYQLTKPLSMY